MNQLHPKTRGQTPAGAATRVAYVMNAFPRLSETFIAQEIHQLERTGLGLSLFVVKREDEPQRHPIVDRIRAPRHDLPPVSSLSGTQLLPWLRRNAPAYAAAHGRQLRRHPLRYLATLGSALGLTLRHWPRKVFVKEFLQAGHIADAVATDAGIGHLHGHFCHGVATITWMASRMSGVPFSFTAHAKDIYQAELNPGRLLERKLGAARFVATCTCANAQVLQQRHPQPARVHTIYHGLDTAHFAPATAAQAASRPGSPLVLAVGRLVEKKGFDTLVEAIALLRAQGRPLRCRIVGEDGSAGDALRAQIARLRLDGSVELHGPVTQDQLREVYHEAQIFALPCRILDDGDRDGFPNVLAEAMASGVPVVSTAISGIPEMVDDGVHGLLVPPQDAAALAAAIARLLDDPELHARIAAAGRQRICERFDARVTTLALRGLFEQQLALRRGLRSWHEGRAAA